MQKRLRAFPVLKDLGCYAFWLRSEIQRLLTEQPIYEIFGSDAVIGSIKPWFKR